MQITQRTAALLAGTALIVVGSLNFSFPWFCNNCGLYGYDNIADIRNLRYTLSGGLDIEQAKLANARSRSVDQKNRSNHVAVDVSKPQQRKTSMAMMNKTIVHGRPDEPFESVLVFDDAAPGPVPGILLVPNVMGLKPSDIELASKMAALGYAVLACDIFGQGKRPTFENPTEYMDVLRADRGLLRDRLHASLATLKEQSQVDAHNVVAIGYCFGGQCVIDMVRSGADILGAISFHGVLDAPDYPIATPAKAKLMILHGWNDPICPPDAVKGIAKELTDAGIDWHLHAYGHAGHSFTHAATTPRAGFGYNEPADRRSWLAMQIFLSELFAEAG